MDVINTYKNYKQYLPDYESWKKQVDENRAKRLEYLRQNPLNEKEKTEAVQRGKTILNAIDTIDEYSQTKSQDTEMVAEMVLGQVQSFLMFLLAIPLALIGYKKGWFKMAEESQNAWGAFKSQLPILGGVLLSGLAIIPFVNMATKAQVGASRMGRFEAMRKELSNPNYFAVLTSEQEKEVDEKSKKITLSDKDIKAIKSGKMTSNPLEGFVTIRKLMKSKEEYKKQRAEFEQKLNVDMQKFESKLSPQEIEKAKKDQQLLLNLVEKIDIASQDYSENTELALQTTATLALGGGAFAGILTDKIISKLASMRFIPDNKKVKGAVSLVMTLAPLIIFSSYFAQIQKLASRIGRFKAKQELAKDFNNFAYVDDEKTKDLKLDKPLEEPKKPNMFKFLGQVFRDGKEYKKYLKDKAVDDRKRDLALAEVKITPQQLKQAKLLQQNTFKTFNKVDDKSQQYSENVEAVGEMLQKTIGSTFAQLGIIGGMLYGLDKALVKKAAQYDYSGSAIGMMAGVFFGLIPTLIINFYNTKEQKKASRVADMIAIKELFDYKHFADYSSIEAKKD